MQLDFLGIFGAGLLTFASPCVLPLVPVYLSMLAGASVEDLRSGARTSRALGTALAFSLGLSLVFVSLGLAASALGRALLAHRALLLQIGGIAVLLFGLKYLGLLRVPWLDREVRPLLDRQRAGGSLLSALLFGAAFGLGWTPCIGPVLGSVLTFAASASSTPAAGAGYLAIYAAGVTVPLLATAALAPLALRWHRRLVPHLRKLEVATGVLLVTAGLLLNTDSLDRLAPSAALAEPPPAASCGVETESPTDATDVPGSASSLAPVTGPGPLRLVELVSDSCPVCQRMVPVLQAAAHDCAGAGIQIVRLDVSHAAGRDAARALRVRGVPTFVFIDRDGNEVARLVGEQPLAALEQSMAVLSGERCDGFRELPASPRGT